MSDGDVSCKDLPFVREFGCLCPLPPTPVKHEKSASDTTAKMTEESEIPDPHLIREPPTKLLDREIYRWPCWACRIKFFTKKDDTSSTSSKGPKNRLRGIEDRAVQEFILKAELRLAKVDIGELFEKEPKKDEPFIDLENFDPFNDTFTLTFKQVAEMLKTHPLGSKGETEKWSEEW